MYTKTVSLLRGEPLGVNFLGFRSDTYRLQQAGWQIAEEKLDYSGTFRIAIRHPDHHISGMSRPVDRGSIFRWEEVMPGRWDEDRVVLTFDLAVLYMIHAQDDIKSRFIPVDATPSYQSVTISDLYNAPYFQPINKGKEIFLRKASVEEIIQLALDKQEPEQARIRAARYAKARRENYKMGGQIKAKLVAID